MWIRLVSRVCAVRLAVVLALVLVALGAPESARGQEGGAPAAAPDAPAAPAAPLPTAGPPDPATPRGAMLAFLEAGRAGAWERAAEHLDLSRISREQRAALGPELARKLKIVLDQTLWVNADALSADPAGATGDDLPADLDRVGTIGTSRGEVPVLLRRGSADGERIWRVAPSTVAHVPQLYAEFGFGPLGELLPDTFFVVRVFEVQLWQWLGLLAVAFLSWLASWAVARTILGALRSLVARSEVSVDDRLLEAVAGPARLVLFVAIFSLGARPLGLAVPVHEVLVAAEKALAVVAATWFLLRGVDVAGDLVRERLERRGQAPAVQFVPLGRKAVKVVLVAFAALAALDTFGFDVTTLIAGLGIGGLAVALAAQKTVENLFGGVTVLADRPVQVGDFFRWGDQVGTVEEIGLRSTRIRTLDRTVVSIPNAEFSTIQLENFARRDTIRLYAVFGVRYETTPDQLRFLLAEIRRLLLAHPRITDDPARVRFVGFGAYSLDLEIFAYVQTIDWNEFLQVREDVFLRVMDLVETAGTGFAFPSQTTYLGKDEPPDPERSRAAEEQVARWRRERELPFPDLAPAERERLRGTLDFPPEGSVLREE